MNLIITEDARKRASPNKLAAVDQLQADLALRGRAGIADPDHAISGFAVLVFHADDAAALQPMGNSA